MTKSKRKRSRASGNGNREEELDRLVVRSMAAWEAGDFAKALELADRACGVEPDAAVAHHCRAAALAELERVDEAREACEQGLQLAPEDPDALTYAADFYLACLADDPDGPRRGLELAQLGLRAARKARDEELEAECLLLCGRGEEQLGRLEIMPDIRAHWTPNAALFNRFKKAWLLKILGEDQEAELERGVLLFELCRLEEARAQLQQLSEDCPELPEPFHYLGLIEERLGDRPAAERCFRRAQALAPDEFFEPIHIPAAEFDGVVEQAFARLPARVRAYLSNVAVTVEDLPREEDLRASDPPLSPLLLGLFRGTPLGDRLLLDPWAHFPSSIVLYQRNLERFARSREELIEQIAITLLHEVGHFLGLGEEELQERGLQ